MLTSFLEILLLVTALSIDAFAASFVYGTDKVKIPATSVMIISALSTGVLVLFLLLGNVIGGLISPETTTIICFIILFFLGLVKLFDSSIKRIIRKYKNLDKKVFFSFSGLTFILTIYADPQTANGEDITILSPAEAFSLGIALSLDSAAAGIGAGMMTFHLPATILLSLTTGILAILSGSLLGNSIAKRTSFDLSWLSGVMLMILAVLKLL